jgi:hypothetical protein
MSQLLQMLRPAGGSIGFAGMGAGAWAAQTAMASQRYSSLTSRIGFASRVACSLQQHPSALTAAATAYTVCSIHLSCAVRTMLAAT